jgi:hypothetical protein
VSSGFHIGSSCWRLQIAHLSLSVVTNASVGADYRHPKKFASDSLEGADLLLMSGFATKADALPYYQQMTNFLNTLLQCLQSNVNSKVLLPCSPTFMLEIVDLLVHKVDERAKIIFLSDAAQALVEYANINLEYLNPILYNKIYHKLIKSGRLLICRDI